ncbi:hypothetical protein SprV_0301337800 [Sparganum proliferum]
MPRCTANRSRYTGAGFLSEYLALDGSILLSVQKDIEERDLLIRLGLCGKHQRGLDSAEELDILSASSRGWRLECDALSHLISNHREPEGDTVIAAIPIEDEVRRQLPGAIRGIPVTAADIRRATQQDPAHRQVITYVQTCWPTTALAGDLRQPFLRRASLSVVDSCLMSADPVVIPSSLRPTVLRQFHVAHPGTCRMKSTARSFAYWPGIDEFDAVFDVSKLPRCRLVNLQYPSNHRRGFGHAFRFPKPLLRPLRMYRLRYQSLPRVSRQ